MNNKETLSLAVAKGYIWEETEAFLKRLGWKFDTDLSQSRQLWTFEKTQNIKVLLVRSWDVPTYVAEGAVDLGIVGKDVLIEQEPDIVELLDLGYGGCELVIAALEKLDLKRLAPYQKVATKYLNSTKTYFKEQGLLVQPIKLAGAIELAPTTGIADFICDLTATGTTLRENGLSIIETVFKSTARLVANPISMRTFYSKITAVLEQLKSEIS